MKKRFLGISALAVTTLLALTACGEKAVTAKGSWGMLTGAGYYANLGFDPFTTAAAVSSYDQVTVYSNDTYVWTSGYNYDYYYENAWLPDLAKQIFVIEGTCTVEVDAELEETTLTITSVDHMVAKGSNWNLDSDVETEEIIHEGTGTGTKENLDKARGIFLTLLSSEKYVLEDGGLLSGTALFAKMLTAA